MHTLNTISLWVPLTIYTLCLCSAAQSVFRQYSATQPSSQQSPVTITQRQQVNYDGEGINNYLLSSVGNILGNTGYHAVYLH